MAEKNSFSFKPIVVLVCICIVISGLLAAVNAITEPVIEAREQEKLSAMLGQYLPNATSFSELNVALEGVSAAYQDDGGSGYAFVTEAGGFHGNVIVTTALDPNGAILGISVDASGETVGIGDRVAFPEFTGQFSGVTVSAADVDVLGGATVSSRGVKQAVDLAFRAYRSAMGLPEPEITDPPDENPPEEEIPVVDMVNAPGMLLPDAALSSVTVETEGVLEAYQDDHGGGYVFITVVKGFYSEDLMVATALDLDGTIIGILVDASGETEGMGERVALPEFTDRFSGVADSADGVDVLAGATVSSQAVQEAVNVAFRAYREVMGLPDPEENAAAVAAGFPAFAVTGGKG